jgi:hypothetical protein
MRFVKREAHSDGNCLFIKREFEIVEMEILQHHHKGKNDDQVSQIAVIQPKLAKDIYLIIGLVHLKFGSFQN